MADQPPNEKGSDRIDDRTPSMDQPSKIVQAPAPTIKVLLRVIHCLFLCMIILTLADWIIYPVR